MHPLLLVMAGGALGAGARHLTGQAMLAAFGPGWPWGTLAVNLVGGLLMGLLVGWLARHRAMASSGGCCSAWACWAGSRPFRPSRSKWC